MIKKVFFAFLLLFGALCAANADDFGDAVWIGCDSLMPGDDNGMFSRVSARYLRKTFRLRRAVKSAAVHVCGLGIYTLDINGGRVGDGDVLSPVGSDYDKRVYYDSYDVTPLVRKGRNAMLLTLEAGYFFAVRMRKSFTTYGMPKGILSLVVTYRDGEGDTIVSDGSWKMTTEGPVGYANYYDGELYDARKTLTGAAEVGYDDRRWEAAETVEAPKGVLNASVTPNMHVYAVDSAVRRTVVAGGKTILDFGVNGAGRLRMTLNVADGDTLVIRYAELLDKDGALYMKSLRTARSTDYFIGDGKRHDWTTEFVYHGFRYAELSRAAGVERVRRELIADRMDDEGTSLVIYGQPLLNAILANARRTIRSDYKGMPLDCPQRDERMPWLGDRVVGCVGESYMMNNHTLYAKWMRDICDSQRDDGAISDVSPAYWRLYGGSVTWPAALPFGCDMLYRQYGDLQPMRDAYPNIRRFMTFIRSSYLSGGLICCTKYGDWCIPPEGPTVVVSGDPSLQTTDTLLSSCYYVYIARMMALYAKMFGYTADAGIYAAEADSMTEAINDAFLHPEGTHGRWTYANGTVTACLLPLAMGICPDSLRLSVDSTLIAKIRHDGTHVSSGVIGIGWLMRYLSDSGHGDIAWQIATTEDYPSWGYMVKSGATTIWELWNGDTAAPTMNSCNHVMLLGDLVIWAYENLGGIRPAAPGFREILLKPDFSITALRGARAEHKTARGIIVSDWRRLTDGSVSWSVSIPEGSAATVCLPDGTVRECSSGDYTF